MEFIVQIGHLSKNQPILVVEDSDEDFSSFMRVLSDLEFYPQIFRAFDGDEALDFLEQFSRKELKRQGDLNRPALILLDLNLPGTDGRDVLAQVKQDQQLASIPVVVFTTSSSVKDIKTCYDRGANSYVVKPMGVNALRRTLGELFHYWFGTSILPEPT
jgi:CheY-like chemotaxis protein